jgi:hypothetical protein
MSPTRRARSSRRSPFQAASTTSAATASTSRTSASNGSAVGDRSGDEPHRAAQSGCGASLPALSPFGMRKLVAPGSNDLGLFPGPRGPGETCLRNCTPSLPCEERLGHAAQAGSHGEHAARQRAAPELRATSCSRPPTPPSSTGT